VYSRIEQARQDEETGAALVGAAAEAHVEVMVDRRQAQAVVQRQQQDDDGDIADHVADQDLRVAEPVTADRTRHADERDAGQGRADHAERDEHPVAVLVADEKAVVVGTPRGDPGDAEQQQEVSDEDTEE